METPVTLLGGTWVQWRTRAVAYTLVYILLAFILVTVRYFTAGLLPQLQQLQAQQQVLETQKKALRQEVETLTSPRYVRAFALSHEMVPFSKASKRSAEFKPLPQPQPLTLSLPRLEIETQWK